MTLNHSGLHHRYWPTHFTFSLCLTFQTVVSKKLRRKVFRTTFPVKQLGSALQNVVKLTISTSS